MGTTADKLNKLLQTKQAIKQAIIDKGVEVTDEDTFASYPEKISSIQGGSGSDEWLDILTDGGTRGEYLFCGCNDLTELDLSNFNTTNVTNMQYMFRGCNELTELDLSNFITTNVTNMQYMFYACDELTELDLSNFDTNNVTSMTYMFSNCSLLRSVNVSSFNTSNVTSMSGMFTYCSSLTSLDCSSFDISKCTSSTSINNSFDSCKNLVDFYPPRNINANMTVSSSTALSHDSLLRILNNLMETTTTKKLTLGSTNLAKLTDEEKAIATNKGWTLA